MLKSMAGNRRDKTGSQVIHVVLEQDALFRPIDVAGQVTGLRFFDQLHPFASRRDRLAMLVGLVDEAQSARDLPPTES